MSTNIPELLREAEELRARRNALLPPFEALADGQEPPRWMPTEETLAEYAAVTDQLRAVEAAIRDAYRAPAVR